MATRNKRKLMDSAVGGQNGPAGSTNPSMNLREPLAPVERLVVLASGVTEAGIEIVEAHKVGVVRCGKEKTSAGTGHAIHFVKCGLHLRKVLDSFAGDDEIKRVCRERKTLRVALNQRRPGSITGSGSLSRRGEERGGGEIASGDARTGPGERPQETAATAGNFKNA